MRFKKTASVLCAASLMMSMVIPSVQASAYEVQVKQLSDGENSSAPVMPKEIATRSSKNYKIVETPETFGQFLNDYVLVMPGDTFEYTPMINEETKSYFYVDDGYMSVKQDYPTEGFDIVGTVDAIETFSHTFTSDGEQKTMTCNVKWKNNTNCPLTVSGTFSGSGPIVPHWGYSVRGISVQLYKPYYKINWDLNGYFGNAEEHFYALGEYDDLTFPNVYWITDTPYTLSVPKPIVKGEHFDSLSMRNVDSDNVAVKDDHVEYTVCWSSDHALSGSSYDFDSYGDLDMQLHLQSGSTIAFNGNGGTVKGRDEWVIEVSDVEQGATDYGYKLSDFVPVRENDEFLGWCTKESALYGSFVTKDSEADIYTLYENSGYSGKKVELYAKWKSETHEDLEKNGWEIDDGTLWLLNHDGITAWIKACEEDSTLAPKVKSVKTGYKDEDVTMFLFNTFKGCVNLTELTTNTVQQLNSANIFDGCTNLKKVTVNFDNGSIWYALSEGTFQGAGKDLIVVVPKDKLEGYKEMFPTIAYLFNSDEKNERYPLTVNGQVITKNDLTVKCGDGTATFDPKTSTLTLENAVMENYLFAHFMPTYYIDNDGNWFGYMPSAIISQLPKLNIVLKGSNVVKTGASSNDTPYFVTAYNDLSISGDGSIEASFYSENYLVTDPETGETTPAPASPGKLMLTVDGDLSLDGITATRLIAEPKGKLDAKGCTFNGGTFSTDQTISFSDTAVSRYSGSYAGFTYPEQTFIRSGKSISIESSTFESSAITEDAALERITIKDSTFNLRDKLSASDKTKLTIINSTFTSWPSSEGVTNIPETNITLTNCSITNGKWTGSEYFSVEPVSVTVNYYFSEYESARTIEREEPYEATVTRESSQGDGFTNQYCKVMIDDKSLSSDSYKLSASGSKLNLKIDADKLGKVGTHKLAVVFDDGSAECEYRLLSSEAPDTDVCIDTDTMIDTDTSDPVPEPFSEGNFDCIVNENGDITIIGYNGSNEDVVVPEEINEKKVTAIGQEAFKDNKTVKSVILPESIKGIGSDAFADCENLSEINLPEMISDIGMRAFSNCALTHVDMPYSLTRISSRAFEGNPLQEVNLPYGLEYIMDSAFRDCSELTEIVIPNTVKDIGLMAFVGCSKLTDVTILSPETTLNDLCFTDENGKTLPVKLHSRENSKAEEYANAHDEISFEIIDDSAKAHLMFGLSSAEGYEFTDGEYIIRMEDAEQSVKLPETVTLDGAEFKGWYRVNWFNGVHNKATEVSYESFIVGDSPENSALAMNIEFYPLFVKKAAKNGEFVLDANGGTIDGSKTGNYDIPNTHNGTKIQFLDSLVPERDGYVFTGWNTLADGSGINTNTLEITPEGRKVFDLTNRELAVYDGDTFKLYAQWSKISEDNSDIPTQSDSDKPAQSDSDKPVQSDSDKPVQSDSDKPVQSDSDKPVQSDSDKPTQSDSDKPVQSDSDKPVQSDSDKPVQSDSDKPSQSDTDNTDTETPHEDDNDGMYGDVDGDGSITANDALMTLRHSVGLITFEEKLIPVADIDGDKSVTANDALAILRSSVGMAASDSMVGKPMKQ